MTSMERPEPSLAPQWWKSGTSRSSNSIHPNQRLGSSPLSDRGFGSSLANNGSWLSASDHNADHGALALKRASSSNSRRNISANGSIARGVYSPNHRWYGSFGRSHHDKDREKDCNPNKAEKVLADSLDDIFDNLAATQGEKGNLRRSKSMITRRQNESFTDKVGVQAYEVPPSSTESPARSIHEDSFERHFPSLLSGDRQGSNDVGPVPSPAHTIASPTPSTIGVNSAAIPGDRWLSVLADVPTSSSGNVAHPTSSASTISLTTTATSGLNMTKIVSQTPVRHGLAPMLSLEAQRREELAIRQSRKLIPVTPASKTLITGSSDKLKSKVGGGEASLIPKVNPSLLGVRSGLSKGCQVGNLVVLTRDRSCLPVNPKEGSNLINVGKGMMNISTSTEVHEKLENAKSMPDLKARGNPMIQNGPCDKRPLQRQKRLEFFNSLRKNGSTNPGCLFQKKDDTLQIEKSDNPIPTTTTYCQASPTHPHSVCSDPFSLCQNGSYEEPKEAKRCLSEIHDDDTLYFIPPTEEELSLLSRLGWKEDEEVECLTEEEIQSFRMKQLNKASSSPLCPASQQ